MKNIIVFMVIFAFICNAMITGEIKNIKEINEKMYGYVSINSNMQYLHKAGYPMLPYKTKTYVFPVGTIIKKINVRVNEIKEMKLKEKIKPAPKPVTMGEKEIIKEGSIYNKDEFYPSNWYDYHIGVGLKNGKHVLFLNIYLYPYRYNAVRNELKHAKFDIIIDYKLPSKSLFLNKYDLLIVAPDKWLNDLKPLVEEKEKHGIKTKLVSLSQCLSMNGRDDAEKLKYYIKNEIEQDGIKYVLLVGGRKPGIKEEWYIPVRYVYVTWPETGYIENRYISDLYYADIYDGDYNFSSWDSDGNGVFSEWRRMEPLQDKLDLYPDVYIGRLACRNKAELEIMINKIIDYEGSEINKKIVLVGGDTFEPEGLEGEIVCDKSLEYLNGFETAKVYASQTNVNPKNIRNALGNGAMFMLLHGHGSPIRWNTCKPNVFDKRERGLWIFDLPFFFNKEYPIAIFGGCHTAMFNISLTVFQWAPPAPECLSWWFARKYEGGGIASLGYTAFPVGTPGESGDLDGNGINEPDCVESGYGYMELGLFYAYGIKNMKYLGECWGFTVGRYIEHFKIPYERYHFHTIQSFVLLGDPTLKIGGYE